jgi:hypothetical protein
MYTLCHDLCPLKQLRFKLGKLALYIPFAPSHNESYKPWPGQAT